MVDAITLAFELPATDGMVVAIWAITPAAPEGAEGSWPEHLSHDAAAGER
jgi:hypothetical protein